jgi:hypothetical protein
MKALPFISPAFGVIHALAGGGNKSNRQGQSSLGSAAAAGSGMPTPGAAGGIGAGTGPTGVMGSATTLPPPRFGGAADLIGGTYGG